MSDYTIGSFNIEHLNNTKDFNKLAEIIKEEKFDLLAIQEAHSKFAVDRIVQELNPAIWDCKYPEGNEEYAFIWKKRKVRLLELPDDKDNPHIAKGYKYDIQLGERDLVRPPYVGYFTTMDLPGGPRFDIRLINTHIIHNKPPEGYGYTTEPDVRRNELTILSREIYADVANNVIGSLRSIFTVMLGDFNLVIAGEGHKIWNELFPSKYNYKTKDGQQIKFEQKEKTTLKRPQDDNSSNVEHQDQEVILEGDISYYSKNYDHFGYEEGLCNKYAIKVSRVDALQKYYDNNLEEYRKKISDHVPIKLQITLV